MRPAGKPEQPLKGQLTIFDIMAAEDAKETAPDSERPEPETGAWMAKRIQSFPPVAELTLEQAAQIIERQTGLGFYTNRFGQKEANAGHGLKITVEKSRYDLDDDKSPFLGVGWSKGTSGGGAPRDTVEEAIRWIRSVMDKWRDK